MATTAGFDDAMDDNILLENDDISMLLASVVTTSGLQNQLDHKPEQINWLDNFAHEPDASNTDSSNVKYNPKKETTHICLRLVQSLSLARNLKDQMVLLTIWYAIYRRAYAEKLIDRLSPKYI